MSRKHLDLSARLRRSRAVSVFLGRRFWYMTPLDRHPGRPTVRESIILSEFKRPILDFDPELYDDQDTDSVKEGLLIEAADKYLAAVGLEQGWFHVVERGNLSGNHVTIRVRDFDILVHRASLLDRCVGRMDSFADRRFPFSRKGVACG